MGSHADRIRAVRKAAHAKSQVVSDSSKLMYKEMMTPMLNAIGLLQQQAGALQNLVAQRMAVQDGVDVNDGWLLDAETLRWVKPPEQVQP